MWKGSRLFEINHCSFEVSAGSNKGMVGGNVNDGFFNGCDGYILNSFYSFTLVSNAEKLHLSLIRYVILSVYYNCDNYTYQHQEIINATGTLSESSDADLTIFGWVMLGRIRMA